jgi:hypothetical protein
MHTVFMQVNAIYTQISMNRITSDCKDVYVTDIMYSHTEYTNASMV